VYIAREGVATSDLFRRPGSHTDLKLIVRRLAEGSPVQLSDYNFYTLASVIKVIVFFVLLYTSCSGAEDLEVMYLYLSIWSVSVLQTSLAWMDRFCGQLNQLS